MFLLNLFVLFVVGVIFSYLVGALLASNFLLASILGLVVLLLLGVLAGI